jgi:hypothetical protein
MTRLLSVLQLDLLAIKAEPESDHEMWPVLSMNTDTEMEEKPVTFTFVSVNGEVSAVKSVVGSVSYVRCACMRHVT